MDGGGKELLGLMDTAQRWSGGKTRGEDHQNETSQTQGRLESYILMDVPILRSDFPGRPDASASDRLRRDLQSAIPQAWGLVPESLQIHPVSGGSVPVGTCPLYPSESPPGENG